MDTTRQYLHIDRREAIAVNNGEIIKSSLEDFAKVQRRMFLARKENAPETYADLKKIIYF